MIELLINPETNRVEVTVVLDPANTIWCKFGAAEGKGDGVVMSVLTATGMVFWDPEEVVCCTESEQFTNCPGHDVRKSSHSEMKSAVQPMQRCSPISRLVWSIVLETPS